MSKLAAELATAGLEPAKVTPRAACFPLYGEGDHEDKLAIEKLREERVQWDQVQATVDDLLNIPVDARINNRKFIRHWRGQCSCWETQR